MAPDAVWWYAKDDEKRGPLTLSALQALANSGDLQADDPVWTPGFESWRSAASIAALTFPPSAATPPPLTRHPVLRAAESVPDVQPLLGGGSPAHCDVMWWYARGEEKRGPITYTELRAVVAGDDLVWTQGLESWRRASSIDGLSFPSQTPQPPPLTVRSGPRPETAAQEASAPPANGGVSAAQVDKEQSSFFAPGDQRRVVIGVIVAVLLFVAVLGYQRRGSSEFTAEESEPEAATASDDTSSTTGSATMPGPRFPQHPESQLAFHALNVDCHRDYTNGINEIQQSQVFNRCMQARAEFARNTPIDNWVAQVYEIKTSQGGTSASVTLAMDLDGFRITFETPGIALLDLGPQLLKPGTPMFETVANLSLGSYVYFDAAFNDPERPIGGLTELEMMSEFEVPVRWCSIRPLSDGPDQAPVGPNCGVTAPTAAAVSEAATGSTADAEEIAAAIPVPPSPTDLLESTEIPREFRGMWTSEMASCAAAKEIGYPADGAVISDTHVDRYENYCALGKVTSLSSDTFAGAFQCEAEGERIYRTITLQRVGRGLSIDGSGDYRRCD